MLDNKMEFVTWWFKTQCITRISRLVFTTVNDWLCFPLCIRTFACHVVLYSNMLPPMLVSPLLIYICIHPLSCVMWLLIYVFTLWVALCGCWFMYSPFELRYVAADLCIHPLSCVMWLLIYVFTLWVALCGCWFMYSPFELRYVAADIYVFTFWVALCCKGITCVFASYY